MSRRQGATLFMTLLAAFKALLYRYTRQEDILIGTPFANRNRIEIENLIGLFVNTLVLRTDLSGVTSFAELVGKVRESALDAFAHQDMPFEKLVEEIQPERSLSQTPVFQVMFSLQNAPQKALDLTALDLTPLENERTSSKFDLTLSIVEAPNGLKGRMEYRADLFDGSTISRMLAHYLVLLEGAAECPSRRVSDLPLLSPEETQHLLVDWNDTETVFPKGERIHELFERQVELSADEVAIVFEDQALSYRELNRRANQLAHYLRSRHVGAEDLVGIHVERSMLMVVAVLGVLKAGAAYVPLDPGYPRQRLGMILEDSRPRAIITGDRLVRTLPESNATVVCVDAEWKAIGRESPRNPKSGTTPENLAYVIFTSGSTGRPKGVEITHRSVVNFLSSMRKTPGMTNRDALLAVTTLSFDIAALEVFLPLVTGARLTMVSRDVAIDGLELQKRMDSAEATVMQATPATWRMLFAAGWKGDKKLKVLCGGEALPGDLAARLSENSDSLWNMYGPTETTIWSTVFEAGATNGISPIGRPIANTQVYILDPECLPVPTGVPGELHIGGFGLARGYLQLPVLAAEKFIPNPFSREAGARMYRTGDLARCLVDGNIEFLGRIDQQVKLRGFRIELGEIEAVLREHAGVREAVVAVKEERGGEKRLVGYVVPAGGQATAPIELRSYLKERLPDYMTPAEFVMLERLPLTPSGKVDRRKLPEPNEGGSELETAYVEPKTDLERDIAGIWQEVLQLDKVGVKDNFFELGGHSLLLVEVQNKVRGTLNRDVLIAEMFKYPTVMSLARYLAGRRDDSSRSLLSRDRAKRRIAALGSDHLTVKDKTSDE